MFHAGHHKTGTTTFQRVLATLQPQLLQHGVHVAVRRGSANMGAATVRPAQRGDWSGFTAILEEAEAALPPDGVLLFSAEDLENCLHDTEFGAEFMRRARANGFGSFDWVFEQRNEFEFFESLYGEQCKHRVVLRYDRMAKEILDHGVFSCASSKFRWHFAFGDEEALRLFRARVRVRVEPQNVRWTDEAVERRYAATLFGPPDRAAHASEPSDVDAWVAGRLAASAACRASIRQQFEARFGAIPPSVTTPNA